MKNKINFSIDIIVLIITAIWISDLSFSDLTTLQYIGLALAVVMVILMIIKFIKKGE